MTPTMNSAGPTAGPEPVEAIPRVLSIAGSDPSGGAGVQADLKSIAANGGYGMAVITALTAQNTTGVRGVHVPPVDFLVAQLESISDDITVDAVKLGMLANAEIIEAVAEWLDRVRPPVVVLDPVMVATSGDRLLDESAEAAMRGLLSRAGLVTPNIPELAVLLDEDVASDWDTVIDQALRLSAAHDVLVLAKGGHLDSTDAPDALVNGRDETVIEFNTSRIDTPNTHGTGCSLSSAVATLRAALGDWEAAVGQTKEWLTESILASSQLHVGKGHGPISHLAGLWDRGGTTPRHSPESIVASWWDAVEDIRDGIDELPFITGLTDGTLSDDAFVWYLAQDALYLRDYSRVLAQASVLAPTADEQAFWADAAHDIIAAELQLHGTWLPSDVIFTAEPSPVTTNYVNHLLASAAKGSYREIIATVLPCFWIYYDVGTRLIDHAVDSNPYAAWLRTYADPAFEAANDEAKRIVAAHAALAGPDELERMWIAFEASSQHELDFFAAPLEIVPGATS